MDTHTKEKKSLRTKTIGTTRFERFEATTKKHQKNTPEDERLEPKNHPIEKKENHLPIKPSWLQVPAVNLPGCIYPHLVVFNGKYIGKYTQSSCNARASWGTLPPANISPELSRKYSSISTEGKTQVAWLLARNKQSLGVPKKIGLRPDSWSATSNKCGEKMVLMLIWCLNICG